MDGLTELDHCNRVQQLSRPNLEVEGVKHDKQQDFRYLFFVQLLVY